MLHDRFVLKAGFWHEHDDSLLVIFSMCRQFADRYLIRLFGFLKVVDVGGAVRTVNNKYLFLVTVYPSDLT